MRQNKKEMVRLFHRNWRAFLSDYGAVFLAIAEENGYFCFEKSPVSEPTSLYSHIMNRLISHIERSISMHKCVVVPSLGGFVAELLPARYDREDHLIYPPKEELRFNAALSVRDGILEDSYARAYGISHRRARVMLDDDVRALRAELVRSGRVSLEKMGELTLNPEGQISYSHRGRSDENSGFSYGLVPCSLPRLAALPAEVAESQPEVVRLHPEGKGDYFYLRIHKRTGMAAAAVLLLAALLVVPWGQISSSDKFAASFVPTELTARRVWADTEVQPVRVDVPKQVQPSSATAAESEPIATAAPATMPNVLATDVAEGGVPVMHEPVGSKYYYVVVATFSSATKAREYYRSHVDKATLPNALVLLSRNKARIYADRFATTDEAQAYIRTMRDKNSLFADAWVYAGR